MTFQDICKANESKTPESMLIVKTNQDTLIEVPEPMYVSKSVSLSSFISSIKNG